MRRRVTVAVEDEDVFADLARARQLLGMRVGRPTYDILRDTYFDTVDGALAEREMELRLRRKGGLEQSVQLTVRDAVSLNGVTDERVFEVPVTDGGLYATLEGSSEVAGLVRAVARPESLRPRLALDIDRESKELKRGLFRSATHRVFFDEIVAHVPGATRTFREVTLRERGGEDRTLANLADGLSARHSVGASGLTTYERIRAELVAAAPVPRGAASHDVRIVLVLLHGGWVALEDTGSGMTVPQAQGSGEEAVREHVAGLFAGNGGTPPDPELVGFAAAGPQEADVEVWLQDFPAREARPPGFVWIPLSELMERVGGPRLRDRALVAGLLVLIRSEVGLRLLREAPLRRGPPQTLPLESRREGAEPGRGPDDLLDLDLSVLDFNLRVLEMAEDRSVPLLERFRFLSILSGNLDEFFVVRVARLRDEAQRRAPGELAESSAARLLDLIAIRTRALQARQYACYHRDLLPALAERGVRVRRWSELDAAERAGLSARFAEDVFPLLTPLRLSSSSVRTFPRLPSFGLAMAAVLRRPEEGLDDLGYVSIPSDQPRFLPVPGSTDVIAIEEVIAADAHALFTGEVQEVHWFRASRAADVEIDEDSSGSLLTAVADEVEGRPFKSVIRLEVASTMPREIRSYLLKEISSEQGATGTALTRADLYEIDGPLDLGGVAELCELGIPGGLYPAFDPAQPLSDESSVFEALAAGDVLVHHPYHDFRSTVGRFLSEAADDPSVVSIKLTLYRTGRASSVMEALLRALDRGKEVSVFVEIKARFDEKSNIEWTRRLVEAGAHVITGIPGFKTHAKTALVVRREEGRVRRYVHIGTGNYNAETARAYTDLGLMSADPDIGADLNDFFNELTGSETPPGKRFRRLLAAPETLGEAIERMIQREIEHAGAGRPARIQAKLNGLADRPLVEALYGAARSGVQIDLLVRSICTLRPEVPGLSQGIRVRSILGRFLEHSRIYYFENAGRGEYYIGSADWRARNLRRRVEVAVPVEDSRARSALRTILDTQWSDSRAWRLRADGAFERLDGEGATSQELFMAAVGPTDQVVR